MSRKLTDAEFIERHRTGNRIRSERTRQRRYEAGKSALTVWIPDTLRTALTTKAANDGATISDTATALLSAALTPSIPEPVTTAERDAQILELKRRGLSSREIAKQVGCGKTTVLDVLKRMEAHQ